MALSFNGSTQYLRRAAAVVTSVPISMACWYKPSSVTTAYTLICVGRKVDLDELFRLHQGANGNIQARVDFGPNAYAETTSSATAGIWQHACAVFASNADRRAYRNGGSKGVNTISFTPSNLVQTDLARAWTHYNSYDYLNGVLAFPAIWNAALTDDEVAILARGVWPPLVRPNNLVAFWPLTGASTEPDIVNGYGMTPYDGPTVADNPRIFMPPRRRVVYSIPATVAFYRPFRAGLWTPGRR